MLAILWRMASVLMRASRKGPGVAPIRAGGSTVAASASAAGTPAGGADRRGGAGGGGARGQVGRTGGRVQRAQEQAQVRKQTRACFRAPQDSSLPACLPRFQHDKRTRNSGVVGHREVNPSDATRRNT